MAEALFRSGHADFPASPRVATLRGPLLTRCARAVASGQDHSRPFRCSRARGWRGRVVPGSTPMDVELSVRGWSGDRHWRKRVRHPSASAKRPPVLPRTCSRPAVGGTCRTYGPVLAARASRSEQEPRCASLMRSAAPAGEGAGRKIETSTSAEHARRRCDLCCRRPRAGRRGVKVERWAVNQNDTSTCLHDWQLSPVVGAQPGAPRGRRGRRARVRVR